MHLGRMLIKTESLAADLSCVEENIKNRTKWVKIVNSMENNVEVYDDKREMTYVAINNSTDPVIKKVLITLVKVSFPCSDTANALI